MFVKKQNDTNVDIVLGRLKALWQKQYYVLCMAWKHSYLYRTKLNLPFQKNWTFTERSISSSDHPDSVIKAVAVTWGLFTR